MTDRRILVVFAVLVVAALAAHAWQHVTNWPCNNPPAGATARCDNMVWTFSREAFPCRHEGGVACYVDRR